jgi:hypothetical protein
MQNAAVVRVDHEHRVPACNLCVGWSQKRLEAERQRQGCDAKPTPKAIPWPMPASQEPHSLDPTPAAPRKAIPRRLGEVPVTASP